MHDAILSFFWKYALPLVAAAGLSGLVGWEREAWGKPAGLRTYMMVGLGAATFTLLALRLIVEADQQGVSGADVSRIVEGVVTGIGFLGAGSIIQARGKVRGITTAAGVWVVGAIGACCGTGYYKIAIVSVVLALIILRLLAARGRSALHTKNRVQSPIFAYALIENTELASSENRLTVPNFRRPYFDHGLLGKVGVQIGNADEPT